MAEPAHRMERMRITVNEERCAGCQECAIRCPTGALRLDAARWIIQGDDTRCVGCRQCERTCPYGAIGIEGPVLDGVRPVYGSFPPGQPSPPGMFNTAETRQGLTTWEDAVSEASRCLQCPDPTCVRGCPAHNNIPGFLQAILEGDLVRAHRILRETTALPDVCSRVCDQSAQCEGACTWHLAGGRPVRIGLLERFVCDHQPVPHAERLSTEGEGLSVAVVGSGPAGIGAAWELVSHGAQVTVFDKDREPGGVLRWGIPSFTLPDALVVRAVRALADAGVVFRLGATVTRETLLELLQTFDAVILAHGANRPLPLRAPGAQGPGVEDATSFLTRAKQALRERRSLPETGPGTRVLVVGAGNTAMDVARSVRRMGGEVLAIDWMDRRFARVRADELHEAQQEGVQVQFCRAVSEVERDESGKVRAVWLVATRHTHPARRPVLLPRTRTRVPVDWVVVAMGYRPDGVLGYPPVRASDPRTSVPPRSWQASGILSHPIGWQAMQREWYLERAGRTVSDRVWMVGDALSGPATVVAAMAQGKRAAQAVLSAKPRRSAPEAVVPKPSPAPKPDIAPAHAPLMTMGLCFLGLGMLMALSIVGVGLGALWAAVGGFFLLLEGCRRAARSITDAMVARYGERGKGSVTHAVAVGNGQRRHLSPQTQVAYPHGHRRGGGRI